MGNERGAMTGSFRDLIVWQKAVELSLGIYKLTATFPNSEQFGLTNQMRRASVSIASNIAEG
jgi:four helix bundle protein